MGREEGSGWGTHVYLWQIHFDIWQNQYNIVKLNKIKFKKKKERNFLYPGLPGSSDSKYLPTMWEIWVQSLGQEDPQGKEWQPTPVFLPGESLRQRNLEGYSPGD